MAHHVKFFPRDIFWKFLANTDMLTSSGNVSWIFLKWKSVLSMYCKTQTSIRWKKKFIINERQYVAKCRRLHWNKSNMRIIYTLLKNTSLLNMWHSIDNVNAKHSDKLQALKLQSTVSRVVFKTCMIINQSII